MTETILLSGLCTLAHVPSLILRYLPFRSQINPGQRRLLVTVYLLTLALNFALCIALDLHSGMSVSFYKLNLLLFCVAMSGVNLLVLRGYPREQLFTFGLVAIIVLMLLTVSSFTVDALTYQTLRRGLIEENIIYLLLFSALYLPIRGLMLRTVTPFLSVDGRDYWNTIWFIPISMFFASLLSTPMGVYTSTVSLLISKLLIGVATLFLCRSVAADYGRLREREGMSRQITLQKQYYDSLTEKVNRERKQRHDFKHHMAAIRHFLDEGDQEALQAYCDELELDIPSDDIPYTGNAAADGVLYYYQTLARRQGTPFEVRGTLEGVKLPDVELCSLLGNALDNAVTASAACGGEGFVRLHSHLEDGLLVLTVDNRFDGILLKKGETILSRKRKDEVGVGMASMREVCQKHGGSCRFEAAGGVFQASFLLQCE